MMPKSVYKCRKPPLNIPESLRRQIAERDKGICQRCGIYGTELHHIINSGMSRRRVHTIENLITLCRDCHEQARAGEVRKWCEQWSRERYGDVVDLIKRYGHKWREYASQG